MRNKKADTIRRCLLHYVCQYGCPSRILSDRGGEFMAHIMMSVYRLLGVQKINTTAMHPQTNAVVERFHGSFLDLLRTITQGRKAEKWEESLPFALFAMRTAYHPAVQDTPFFLMYGREPKLLVDLLFHINDGRKPTFSCTSVGKFRRQLLDQLITARKEAKLSIERTQTKRLRKDSRRDMSNYVVGDRVWLYMESHANDPVRKKLAIPWHGPFRVIQVLTQSVVKLQSAADDTFHPIVNVCRLRRCTDWESRPAVPPTDLVDGIPTIPLGFYPADSIISNDDGDDEAYDVEEIKGERYIINTDGKVVHEYLVKFLGYEDRSNKWLPVGQLSCSAKIRKFRRQKDRVFAPDD
jgi:hypothetical protein